MDDDRRLEMQIANIILDVANSYNDVTISDLQGMADAAARKIVDSVRKAGGQQNR